MSNNQENGVYGQQLAYLLRDNINNKVQDFRSMCREMIRTNAETIPVCESSSSRGRLVTTSLVKKKFFSFSFPVDFDTTCFSGINKMLSNLENWEVQCRKRNSGICDTYYIHNSINGGKKLRSVTEVVNNLLPEGYAKLETWKRNKKDDEYNDEENKFEIEANENNIPQIMFGDLLPHNLSVPRKKRNYRKKRLGTKKANCAAEKEKKIEVGNDVCSQETHDIKNNFEAGNASCSQEMEGKEINMNMRDVSKEALICLYEVSTGVSLSTPQIRVQKRNHAEVEKNIVVGSSTYPQEVLENKENNIKIGNIFGHPLEIGDKKTKYAAEKEKKIDVCSQETHDIENNFEAENASCPQEIKRKEINMNVGDVSKEALSYLHEVSTKVSLSIHQVRVGDLLLPSVFVPRKKRDYKRKVHKRNHAELEKNIAHTSSTFPQEVLEHKKNNVETKNVFWPPSEGKENNYEVGIASCHQEVEEKEINYDVANDWKLTEEIDNYEVLPEITEDFSEFDDLIASFLK
ncbi:unnamed protein product [Vicia faba]|uniref:Uncharacterized protein n=1 Tax=Vicia faba TaxID=3906 RepID=A0AAV0ZTB4_VICFA|nr:unnamed protein product [Vicia faba]